MILIEATWKLDLQGAVVVLRPSEGGANQGQGDRVQGQICREGSRN